MEDLERVFGADGPLAARVPGFVPRPQQLEMARAIAQAIAGRGVLVAEAGTGTGKTFAYLAPALASGGKVLLSTGTKTLQDQLFQRDLPTVRDALGMTAAVALLKGRANYVCRFHLERALRDGRFATRQAAEDLQRVRAFAARSRDGDRNAAADVPENSPVWPAVTSTRDNCLGGDCEHYDECFVMQARREALAADVVVVNHHLFFADLVLRDEGVAELLPACNTVIFDEAHQLPDTATLFFGASLGTGQLLELARDARAAAVAHARDFAALPQACDALEKAVRDLRLAAGLHAARWTREQALAQADFRGGVEALARTLQGLVGALDAQAERAAELANAHQRAQALRATAEAWRDDAEPSMVRWAEVSGQSLQLHQTPLSVAETFGRQISAAPRGWIFTSATLAVGGDFRHFCSQLGLEGAATGAWDSPFDYPRNALLYVPEALPDPSAPDFTEWVVAAALPVIRASGGRAFVLFTTLRALNRARDRLREALAGEFPLLVQGEGARSEMLERFRALGNAVLLGSQSFWEGVDVRGPALSLVVIDKLPFAPPDDPVYAARLQRIREQGGNPFNDYQLPEAVLSLKQGAGRLIRSETDRGVLMVCDPRLATRPYGRRIVASLPPMRRTRRLEDAVAFLQAEAAVAAP